MFKKEEKETEKDPQIRLWMNNSIYVHSGLYQKGLGAVMLSDNVSHECFGAGDQFPITTRNLKFGITNKKNVENVRKLLQPLQDKCAAVKELNDQAVICNLSRREECFVPFIVKPEFGFYVYPWLSKGKNFNFSGFSKFVTAGCMFGSTLKGCTNLNAVKLLIKHDISFLPDEKIVDIKFDPLEGSPYETMLFEEFTRLADIIDKIAASKEDKVLFYHLPAYDYMLFGIKLFIHNQITLNALDKFFKTVLIQKQLHINKINNICDLHEIKVTFVSPFQNLFGFLETEESLPKDFADYILKKLKISCEEKVSESDFVEKICLKQLQENTFDKDQQEIWKDFLSAPNKKEGIEDLFKIGNALIIGSAAKNQPDSKVCVIEALSEKQIQVEYQKNAKGYVEYIKKIREKCGKIIKEDTEKYDKIIIENFSKQQEDKYPCVFNLTYLDQIGLFRKKDKTNPHKLLFYYSKKSDNNNELANLISKHGFLANLHKNVVDFALESTNLKQNETSVLVKNTPFK